MILLKDRLLGKVDIIEEPILKEDNDSISFKNKVYRKPRYNVVVIMM